MSGDDDNEILSEDDEQAGVDRALAESGVKFEDERLRELMPIMRSLLESVERLDEFAVGLAADGDSFGEFDVDVMSQC